MSFAPLVGEITPLSEDQRIAGILWMLYEGDMRIFLYFLMSASFLGMTLSSFGSTFNQVVFFSSFCVFMITPFVFISTQEIETRPLPSWTKIPILFFLFLSVFVSVGLVSLLFNPSTTRNILCVVVFYISLFILSSIQFADKMEKGVIFRLRDFRAVKGPGIFFVLPIIDRVRFWIDTKTNNTLINIEKVLTKDKLIVDVGINIVWRVIDAKKASLDVTDYKKSTRLVAESYFLGKIGEIGFSDIPELFKTTEKNIKDLISKTTETWGVLVQSATLKDLKFGSSQ